MKPFLIFTRQHALVISITCFLLLSFACSDKDDNGATSNDSLPTAAELQKINLTAGEQEGIMILSDGTEWEYRISIPELNGNDKVPLMLNLHWSGGYNSYIESMRCLVEPAFKEKGYFIFSPRIAFGHNWFEEETRNRILRFIELAISNWPVDATKVAVTGYSLGGTGCWNYAVTYPDIFSAAIPMAGSYFAADKLEIPVTVIHGTNDQLYQYNLAADFIEESNAKGSQINLIEAEGLTHNQACDYIPYLRDAADWLDDVIWE